MSREHNSKSIYLQGYNLPAHLWYSWGRRLNILPMTDFSLHNFGIIGEKDFTSFPWLNFFVLPQWIFTQWPLQITTTTTLQTWQLSQYALPFISTHQFLFLHNLIQHGLENWRNGEGYGQWAMWWGKEIEVEREREEGKNEEFLGLVLLEWINGNSIQFRITLFN